MLYSVGLLLLKAVTVSGADMPSPVASCGNPDVVQTLRGREFQYPEGLGSSAPEDIASCPLIYGPLGRFFFHSLKYHRKACVKWYL